MRSARGNRPMARWKLFLLLAFALVFVGIAMRLGPGVGLLLLLLGWVALGVSAFRWGYDSRDGLDWDDRPRRRPVSPDVRLPERSWP